VQRIYQPAGEAPAAPRRTELNLATKGQKMTNSTIERLRSGVSLDKKNGWIAGVFAGLANYLHTDPAFVRVAAIIAALFFPKLMIAAYLITWLLLNEARRKGD